MFSHFSTRIDSLKEYFFRIFYVRHQVDIGIYIKHIDSLSWVIWIRRIIE